MLNFDQVLLTIDGKEAHKPDRTPYLIREVITDVLMGNYDEDKNISGADKIARFELASKVIKGGDLNLSPREITMIEDMIMKYGTTMTVGRVNEILKAQQAEQDETK